MKLETKTLKIPFVEIATAQKPDHQTYKLKSGFDNIYDAGLLSRSDEISTKYPRLKLIEAEVAGEPKIMIVNRSFTPTMYNALLTVSIRDENLSGYFELNVMNGNLKVKLVHQTSYELNTIFQNFVIEIDVYVPEEKPKKLTFWGKIKKLFKKR